MLLRSIDWKKKKNRYFAKETGLLVSKINVIGVRITPIICIDVVCLIILHFDRKINNFRL